MDSEGAVTGKARLRAFCFHYTLGSEAVYMRAWDARMFRFDQLQLTADFLSHFGLDSFV